MQIHTIDLNFQGIPEAIAAYLVQGPEGWLLIETGPMTTLDRLRHEIRQMGLSEADIKHVLVTHIHLDHAGAAGWWASQGAQLYVHHVGAPHLIDPSRLWRSAGRIYGDRMEQLWGEMVPAPAEQVIALADGDQIHAAGLTLTALDTPGHAGHHHVFRLERIAFSGDAAGVRIPRSEWVSLPAPPPEFNAELWHQTLDRLLGLDLDALYLTHFGRVDDVRNQLDSLRTLIEAATGFVQQHLEAGSEREELLQAYTDWNREQALAAGLSPTDFLTYELANPLFMSVDGIVRYLRNRS